MTEEEFRNYCERIDGGPESRKSADKELNEKIDVRDWQDDELDDLIDFQREEEDTEQ